MKTIEIDLYLVKPGFHIIVWMVSIARIMSEYVQTVEMGHMSYATEHFWCDAERWIRTIGAISVSPA